MNAFFVCLILYFAVSPTWGQLDEQTIQNFDWNKDSAFIDQLLQHAISHIHTIKNNSF